MSVLKTFIFIVLLLGSVSAQAQESLGNYQIRLAPDRDDWIYQLGEI